MASVGSQGAGGITFEDCVVANYLCALLREGSAPGLDSHVVYRIAVQQRHAGYPLDDLVVHAKRGSSQMTLSLEIKSTLDVTRAARNVDFREVVHRAWSTMQAQRFRHGIDRVGVVTGSTSKARSEAMDKICGWAQASETSESFFMRFQPGVANDTDRTVVGVVQALLGELKLPERESTYELLRHFVLVEFDFTTVASKDEAQAIELLRSMTMVADDAPKLWATVRTLVRDGAPFATEYDRARLLHRASLDFELKEHVLASAPVVMNLSALRPKRPPLRLSPVFLAAELWGNYSTAGEPRNGLGRLAQVARDLAELKEDVGEIETVAPVGREVLSVQRQHRLDPAYLGICEISFQGDLHVKANATTTLKTVVDLPVRDHAWQELVADRIPSDVLAPAGPASLLTISVALDNGERRHIAPGSEVVVPVTVSYRLDSSRDVEEIAQSNLRRIKSFAMLAAADALRSYTESSSHELDLPVEVFGEPTVRTLRLRPSATRKDHREWRLMGALGGERLQDLIRRWKKIQSAVDQEVERRLKAALRDGA